MHRTQNHKGWNVPRKWLTSDEDSTSSCSEQSSRSRSCSPKRSSSSECDGSSTESSSHSPPRIHLKERSPPRRKHCPIKPCPPKSCPPKPCPVPQCKKHLVVIPDEDRFLPFGLTIEVGDIVEWINKSEKSHTVTGDDPLNNISPRGVDQVIEPGKKLRIKFGRPGQWIYFCRFNSHLDNHHQPIAPGCGEDGQHLSGIVTKKFRCCKDRNCRNFGTPMMGVITILPKRKCD